MQSSMVDFNSLAPDLVQKDCEAANSFAHRSEVVELTLLGTP